MPKRKPIPQKKSENYFTATAKQSHPKNTYRDRPMRGGFRA